MKRRQETGNKREKEGWRVRRERKHYHTYPSIRVGQRDLLHKKDGKTRTYATNVGEKERLHPNSTPPVSFTQHGGDKGYKNKKSNNAFN